jgi:hypothetical protein
MTLEEVQDELAENYSAKRDGEVLLVQNANTQSEFVIEQFGNSLQVRQAVWFDCLELSDAETARLYQLCSEMNGRFSGCKSYVDQWGTLITAADIVEESANPRIVEVVLGQVEFVSVAMHGISDGRMVLDEEIDEALESPSLH